MAMEQEETLRRVKSDVRSVLLSAPRGVLKRNFRREYMSLVGQDIPLGKLGMKSMDEFVNTCPDVVQERMGSTGEPTYFVVANAQTQHVASLVARQKKPSLKALRKAAPVRRTMPKRRSYKSSTSFRPAPSRAHRMTSRPLQPPPTSTARTSRLTGHPLLRGSITAIQSQKSPLQGQAALSFVPAGGESYNQRLATSSVSHSSKGESNRGIPPWKDEYNNAFVFNTVDEVIRSKGQCKDKLICVTGYPANYDTIKQYEGEFRVLLFNNFVSSRLKAPVLNTFFGNSWWKLNEYRDPLTLPARGGCKLKVWGILQYRFWQVRGDFRHSLKGVYYEYVDTVSRSVSGGQSLKITVAGNAAAKGNNRSPRLSSSSSIDSSTDYSSASGRSSPVTSSLQEWLKDQLKDKPNGLWGRLLVSQYAKDFKTESPHNLLKEICSQPFINFEEAVEGNPIVYLTIEKKTLPIPDYAELPISDKDWVDVLVVSVNDPCDFYVQCLSENCSKALEKLTEDMNSYYSKCSSSETNVTDVRRDVLYGVCWTESSEWCRALVLDNPDSHSMVHVKYPDYGNEDNIPVSNLCKLPHQFYKLPLQAIHCSLINFTDVSDKAIKLFMDFTFEKCCAVMVIERSCDQYTVDLIPPDTDDSIMDLIGQALNPVEGLIPSLPKVDDGRVSVKLVEVCLNDPGYVFVNMIGRGTEILNRILNTMDEHYQAKGPKNQLSKHELEIGMVCCAEFEGHWHRVRVTKLSSENVSVQYLDYGTEELDPPRLMKPPNDHYSNSLPPQAIKCKLHGIEYKLKSDTGFVLEFLQDYLEQELYLEMVNDSECILYDQLNDRNINEDIAQYITSSQPSPKPPPPVFSPTTTSPLPSPLPPPVDREILKRGRLAYTQSPIEGNDNDVILVTVTHCVSPNEFFIQLSSIYEKLQRLQKGIQKHVNNESPQKLMEYKEGLVGIGQYHSDNQWYRVFLKDTLRLSRRDGRIIKEIPVLFVDYGNEGFINEVLMITNNHLNQLPFQAIPAKLHIPDGATLQCSSEKFVKLTIDKQFYCHVKMFDDNMKRYSVSLMDVATNKMMWELL